MTKEALELQWNLATMYLDINGAEKIIYPSVQDIEVKIQ